MPPPTPVKPASRTPTKNHGRKQAATYRAEQLADGVEQIFAMPLARESAPSGRRNESPAAFRFFAMPEIRGSSNARSSDSGRIPSPMPTKPKNKPAGAEAEYREAEQQTIRPANMIGGQVVDDCLQT